MQVWYLHNGSEGTSDQPRPGHMGHIMRIANHVVQASAQESIQKIIAQLPDDVRVTWDNFVKTSLTEVMTRLKQPLVAEAPSSGYGESHQQESALHQVIASTVSSTTTQTFRLLKKAFIEYQMQQMTRNLCTQIGFNTSEFSDLDDVPIQYVTLTLFRTCCS